MGTGQNQYKSKEGYPAQEELPIKKASAKNFDGVIIPGGYAPDHLRRHSEINLFVKNMFKSGKLVAAICHGGWVLVSAGILKGKKVTSFIAIKYGQCPGTIFHIVLNLRYILNFGKILL